MLTSQPQQIAGSLVGSSTKNHVLNARPGNMALHPSPSDVVVCRVSNTGFRNNLKLTPHKIGSLHNVCNGNEAYVNCAGKHK